MNMKSIFLPKKILQSSIMLFLFSINYSLANASIATDMQGIHSNMESLFPLAVKQDQLNTTEMNLIINNIEALKLHVGNIKPESDNKSESFKISYSLLANHLDHIQAALLNKEDQYALSLIREIPQMCTACHTQDEHTTHFDSSSIKAQLNSDFLRGEYHFMTRDYQEALLDYNDHLAKQKKIKPEKQNSEAMEKILLIYLQVFRDTDNARMYFERLLNSEKLNASLAVDVNYWLASLKTVQYSPAELQNIQTLDKEVKAVLNFKNDSEMPIFINDENKVNALWVRASIYDFMNRHPTHADTAKLLYWLASLESALDYGLSYQLPEIYLKHCIITYPNHPYAKKCYEQYQLQVEFQYTGSGGTHLPLYKKMELESLEKIIK